MPERLEQINCRVMYTKAAGEYCESHTRIIGHQQDHICSEKAVAFIREVRGQHRLLNLE